MMDVTIILAGRCFICGYLIRGRLFTSGRPGMRTLRIRKGPCLALWPDGCPECGNPSGNPVDEQLDPVTIASLEAWQERQRARRKGAA